MKPWEAAFLSPLNAVLLIVARMNPDGETLAELIPGLSPIDRRTLQYKRDNAAIEEFGAEACRAGQTPADYENNYGRAFKAIRPAQKLLEGWLAQGQIGAVAGVARVAALDCMRREIDYEHSALVRNGVPPLRDIAFERADIERLCAPSPNSTQPLAEANPPTATADVSQDEIVGALKEHFDTNPRGTPDDLRPEVEQQLGKKIDRDLFREAFYECWPGRRIIGRPRK